MPASQFASSTFVLRCCLNAIMSKPLHLNCRQCGICDVELGRKMLLCAQCKSVHYCSTKCQSAHWKAEHKTECTVMSMRRQEMGEQLYDDLKKWCDKNRYYMTAIAVKLLRAYSETDSMLSSHVVHLEASYYADMRAVKKLYLLIFFT